MLSEIIKTEKDKYCMISLICGIKKVEFINQRVEWCLVGTWAEGIGKMFIKVTNFQLVDQQVQRSNVLHSYHFEQYYKCQSCDETLSIVLITQKIMM